MLGDIRDPAPSRAPSTGCDLVFHNVAQVPLAKDADAAAHGQRRRHPAAAARAPPQAGVAKVVHTSSSAVFGVPEQQPGAARPRCPSPQEAYGHAKLAAEWACLDAVRDGLDVSIVRPADDPRSRPARDLRDPVRLDRRRRRRVRARRRHQPLPVRARRRSRRRLLAAGGTAGPGMFNAGTDRFGTMFETLDALCRHAGTGANVRRLPAAPASMAMRASAALGVTPFAPYHWLMYSKSLWFDIEHARTSSAGSRPWSNDEMFAAELRLVRRASVECDARRQPASPKRPPGRVGIAQAHDEGVATRRGSIVRDLRNSQWWRLMWFAVPAYVCRGCACWPGRRWSLPSCASTTTSPTNAGCRSPIRTSSTARPPAPPVRCARCSTCSRRGTACGTWTSSATATHASVPPDVTYHMDEARAAFFPLFPLLGRAFDRVLPGGDSMAVLVMNTIFGFVAVVLVGVLGARLYGERVGRTTTTLMALFPGSFVLTLRLQRVADADAGGGVRCCACTIDAGCWPGVFAALTTATRPNGVAIVLGCVVAAFFAIRDDRDWRALSRGVAGAARLRRASRSGSASTPASGCVVPGPARGVGRRRQLRLDGGQEHRRGRDATAHLAHRHDHSRQRGRHHRPAVDGMEGAHAVADHRATRGRSWR